MFSSPDPHSVHPRGSRIAGNYCFLRFDSLAGVTESCVFHRYRDGSGSRPAFYPVGSWEGEQDLGVDFSHFFNTEEWWSYTSTPPFIIEFCVINETSGILYLKFVFIQRSL
jgi:hypothetical protein